METCSGKETLYDAVGILYQNILNMNEDDDFERNEINSNEELTSHKRRRTLDIAISELMSYNNKPKLREYLLPVDSPLREIYSSSFNLAKTLIFMWIFSHHWKINSTTMWVGLIVYS